MKLLLILIGAFLIGCASGTGQAQGRPTAAGDPSYACYDARENTPSLSILKPKVGRLFSGADPTIEMRANQTKPTLEEKQALSEWGQARQQCAEMGRSYRASYAPPGWAAAFDESQSLILQAIANLYGGSITYGQFIAERERIGNAAGSKMQEADQLDITSRRQQVQQAQDRANAALRTLSQALPPPQPPAPVYQLPRNQGFDCTTTKDGERVNTSCR